VGLLFRNRVTAIWGVLVLATVLSWIAGTGHGDAGLRNAAVIAIALIKARFVALDFMEARSAPLAPRLFIEAWVLVLGAMLIAITAA
jgi:hypothetical protein